MSREAKQRLWCGGIALIVSALVGLSIATWVTSDVQGNVQKTTLKQSSQQALANCLTIQQGRVAGDQFRFAVREELSFIPQLVAASRKHGLDKRARVFFAALVAKLNVDLTREQRTVPGLTKLLPARITGYGDLFPLLADQPLISCQSFR